MNFYLGLSQEEAISLREFHLAKNNGFKAGVLDDYIAEEGWLKKSTDSNYSLEPTPSIESISARDLESKEFEPLNWVVDRLIPEGLIVLAGAPKIGKSFLCWNLALAVAQAGNFLSQYEVSEKKNVLYFALEDPERQIKNRLQMIQPYSALPSNLQIYTSYPIFLGDDGLDQWETTIEEHQAELVIIDTMHHVLPRNDTGTAYQQDYTLLAPVQQMVHRLGISMVLVTHTRKMADAENPFNMIQGSVGVQAACDTMLMLTTVDGDKVLHVNGREVLGSEIAVEIQEGVFVASTIKDREDSKLSDIRSEIAELLKDAGSGGLTMTAIVVSLDRPKETVQRTIQRMRNDEQIYQPKKRGRYYYEKPDEFKTEVDDVPL